MDEQALLDAIAKMIDTKMQPLEDDITDLKDSLASTKQELRKDIQHDMVVLLDTQVKTWFNLLADSLDIVKTKMPSEDDMDIIDDRLAEHDAELKVLRQDVNSLKKAQ